MPHYFNTLFSSSAYFVAVLGFLYASPLLIAKLIARKLLSPGMCLFLFLVGALLIAADYDYFRALAQNCRETSTLQLLCDPPPFTAVSFDAARLACRKSFDAYGVLPSVAQFNRYSRNFVIRLLAYIIGTLAGLCIAVKRGNRSVRTVLKDVIRGPQRIVLALVGALSVLLTIVPVLWRLTASFYAG